jgi:hypothetical protein
VLKIPTNAKPENVSGNPKGDRARINVTDMKQNFNHIRQHRTTDQHADRPNVFLFFALPHFFKTILWLTRIWHIWFCPKAQADPSQNQKSQIFPRSVWLLCILTSLFSIDSFAQIPMQAPTVPSLSESHQQEQLRIQQQNRQLMQQFGHTPPPTQADIQAAQQRQLQGKPPELAPRMKMEKEMVEILKESQNSNSATNEKGYYNSAEFKNDLSNYIKAKDIIKAMLNNQQNLSIKDAFYFSEAAFGSLHLNNQEYNNTIKSNTDFIKQWLKENGYNLTDQEALHFGIQKFVSDTLYITVDGKKQGHVPYYYDYIDALSGKDRRNYFVTKTIATGSGQCHTFPITYLILAEALGVEANLAYNPMHSFIRFKNNAGTVINYETTVDKFLPNSFYIETLPVMAEAQRNSLYVTELNKKQVVASVLFDLAVNFIKEHWLHDKTFVSECISIAKPYFPNQGFINTANNYLHKRLYAEDFNNKIQEKGIKDFNDIQKYPDVFQAYKNYYGYMESVSKLGIQDFPEAEYLRMLSYYDQKGKLQTAQKINSKSKKSLFIN